MSAEFNTPKLLLLRKQGRIDQDNVRSCRSQMFFKIGVPKNFIIFTGKNLHSILF